MKRNFHLLDLYIKQQWNIDKKLPSNVEKEWKDDVKQYYVQYEEKNATKKIWIEDVKSIKEKLNLVTQYNLGGVSSWEIDRADDNVWGAIKEVLE